MTEPSAGVVRVDTFVAFVPRFEELIASSTRMAIYFIHSRRWRENHDDALRAFLARENTSLEVFLPDLESHELMYSLEKHFEDGLQIPALVVDAYRYFARAAREFRKPSHVWLFHRYPTYSFYRFDERAVIALYSNTSAKKRPPVFEVTMDSLVGSFLASDIEDLRRECRRVACDDLEHVIERAAEPEGPADAVSTYG